MKQRQHWHAVLAVVLVVAAVAVAGCSNGTTSGSTGGGDSQPPVNQKVQTLVGSRWLLTQIADGNQSRAVPETFNATWQFTADQQFLASDTVNAISGRYRFVQVGFTTIDAATTLVGYAGSDPVRLAVISGFQKMTSATVAVSVSSPAEVVMRVPGFVMTFRRSGPAQTFPPASPTSSASH
jgi:hypothetical protein